MKKGRSTERKKEQNQKKKGGGGVDERPCMLLRFKKTNKQKTRCWHVPVLEGEVVQ